MEEKRTVIGLQATAHLPPLSLLFEAGVPAFRPEGVFGPASAATDWSDTNWILSLAAVQRSWSGWTKQEIDLTGLTQVKEMTLAPLGVTVSTPPFFSLGGSSTAGQLIIYDFTFISTIPFNEQEGGTPETQNWLPNSGSASAGETPYLAGFKGGPTDPSHIIFGQITERAADTTMARSAFQIIEQTNYGSMDLIGTDKLYVYRVIAWTSSGDESSQTWLFQVPPQNVVLNLAEVDVDSLSHSMAMYRNVGNTARKERRGAE